jgi:citrate lyase subunit beta/citryl-CoA lyase
MSETYLPRRSVLYMPGANDKALEKAKGLAADAIIFDTEDSVAPDMKVEARAKVAAEATSGEYGERELTIRVNAIETDWFVDDLRSACEAGPAGIVVPKVSSLEDVETVEALMDNFGAPDHTRIWAMLETPAAVVNAVQIATSSERLAVLVMGTNDLARELHAALVPGRHPLLWGLGACVNAARAAGKVILDGVFNDIRDADGFAAECRQGAEMGFDGKTLIHPSQLDAANEAFAPSADEVAHSRRVIEAFDEGIAAGKGVIQLDGKMIENLHVANARRAIDMADAIAARSTA